MASPDVFDSIPMEEAAHASPSPPTLHGHVVQPLSRKKISEVLHSAEYHKLVADSPSRVPIVIDNGISSNFCC